MFTVPASIQLVQICWCVVFFVSFELYRLIVDIGVPMLRSIILYVAPTTNSQLIFYPCSMHTCLLMQHNQLSDVSLRSVLVGRRIMRRRFLSLHSFLSIPQESPVYYRCIQSAVYPFVAIILGLFNNS